MIHKTPPVCVILSVLKAVWQSREATEPDQESSRQAAAIFFNSYEYRQKGISLQALCRILAAAIAAANELRHTTHP
ncbi:MAG TPA: hypothetical protein ENI06_11385 [Spirochaetales bacterium]|nr:hypothetical protein [Spirochaetales bacterium]